MHTITVTALTAFCLLWSTSSQASDWEKVWGPTEFAVVDDATGAVYAKPASGSGLAADVYRWSGEPMVWTALGMPGSIKKCVTAGWKPNNKLYCLATDGSVHQFDGTSMWTSIGGPVNNTAGDIYGGPDALLATAPGASADVYKLDENSSTWKKIGGPGKTFVVGKSSDPEFKIQLFAQSPDTAPANTAGVYQWVGSWKKRGGPAGKIYVSQTMLFATNPVSGDILSPYATGWRRIGGPGKMFATDQAGHLFAVSPDSAPTAEKGIYKWDGVPNKWTKIGGPAAKIFAGWDRLLFATNPVNSDLWHYRPQCPSFSAIPNFAGTIVSQKMKPVLGKRPMVVILWDPKRPDHPAPSKQVITSMLFGASPSVKDWFKENSGGKVDLKNAGVLGWYGADAPHEHYWRPESPCGHGFKSGHVEKYTEAIKKASNDFNFASYDDNNDKKLTNDELAIYIVIPQNNADGFGRPTAGQQVPNFQPLIVQGVEIPWIVEWYAGSPPHFGIALHELVHLVLNAPDMYFTEPWPYAAAAYSIADQSRAQHLDPYEKLKLGWLKWKVATSSGVYSLKDVETQNEALILYNPNRGPEEYFILENRWRGTSYDAGVSSLAGAIGIPADGLAVWHIIENPAAYQGELIQPGGGWGRWVIQMVRANGGTPVDDTKALFSQSGTVLSDATQPANLHWLVGPSGFRVKLLSNPGPELKVRIDIACP